MLLRASCSDGANRLDAELKSESHWHKVSVRPGGDAACPFPESREFGLGDNSSRNPGSAGADVAHSAQSHGRESRAGNCPPRLVKIFMRRDCSIGVGRRDVLDSGCHVADPAQAEQGQGRAERCSCLGGCVLGDNALGTG